MKKYLFIALAAAGMLSSCSSDDTVANEVINSEDLVPIKIGMGNIATNVTRGTGSVGASGASLTNTWAGEKVNVFMLKKGSMTVAKTNGSTPTDIFNNEVFTTPTGKVGTEIDPSTGEPYYATSATTKYYPASGEFDFWGYRTDGAENGADPTITAEVRDGDNNITTDGTITIPVDIDGSMDVMGAQCDLAAAATALGNDRFFSAYSARHDVNPNLLFKHMLSRLTFQVKGNNVAAGTVNTPSANPVIIKSIKVYSRTTGQLVIASTAAGFKPGITWDADVWNPTKIEDVPATGYSALTLKDLDNNGDGQLDDIDPTVGFSLLDKTDFTQIGEALLVAPGQTAYRLEVELTQPGLDPAWEDTFVANINFTETDNTDPQAPVVDKLTSEAGTNYVVKITVYGLEGIKVQTELAPWIDYTGDPINIDPDL